MNPFDLPGIDVWLPPLILAPIIGSFMGTLILRLPEERPVVAARSACDRCGHTLGMRDLVPLVSYLLARGRCRYCGQPIGSFVLWIELAAIGVALWTLLAGVPVWAGCVLGWTLLTLAWIDARTMLLPDVLTLPLLAAGLFVTWLDEPADLAEHAAAAALGYAALYGIAWGYRRLRGRDGLGLGDAKLLAALGAWIGAVQLPWVLFLAACLGLAAAGVSSVLGRRMTAATAIPFGPFLALAGWLIWLYGDWVDAVLGG